MATFIGCKFSNIKNGFELGPGQQLSFVDCEFDNIASDWMLKHPSASLLIHNISVDDQKDPIVTQLRRNSFRRRYPELSRVSAAEITAAEGIIRSRMSAKVKKAELKKQTKTFYDFLVALKRDQDLREWTKVLLAGLTAIELIKRI
ncbi:MAG: hypothetical protein AAFR84_22805 [Pseudomonadota bacterium]